MIVIEGLTEVQFNKLDAKIVAGLNRDHGTVATRWIEPIIEDGVYSMTIQKNVLKYLPRNLKNKIRHRVGETKVQDFKDQLDRDGTNT